MLDKLPVDIILIIFGFLCCKEITATMLTTRRLWNSRYLRDYCRKRMFFHKERFDIATLFGACISINMGEFLDILNKYNCKFAIDAERINGFIISGSKYLPAWKYPRKYPINPDMRELFLKTFKLKYLRLENIDFTSCEDEERAQLFELFNTVEKLSLSWCYHPIPFLELRMLNNFEKLELIVNPYIDFEILIST